MKTAIAVGCFCLCVGIGCLVVVAGHGCTVVGHINDPLLEPMWRQFIEQGCRVEYQKKLGISGWFLDGRLRVLSPRGSCISEYVYRRGVWSGTARTWHENGVLGSDETYREGKLVGVAKLWDSTGRLVAEIPYSNGERSGVEKVFNPAGSGRIEISWEHGKPIRVKEFEDGRMIRDLEGIEARDYVLKRKGGAIRQDK